MIPALREECVKEARTLGVTLPSDFSVTALLRELGEAMLDIQPAVLKTAASLRRSGNELAVQCCHSESINRSQM